MSSLPKIFSEISSIAENFRGVLLDAYGVFWHGNEMGLLSGAKEAMERLVSSGKIVGILSNSTQLASKERNKLSRHGLLQGTHFNFLMTSGEITRSIFLSQKLTFDVPRKKFWLFGGAHPKFSSHEAIFCDTIFKETSDIAEADFIYISIPHIDGEDQTDHSAFQTQIEKLMQTQLPMICANPDLYAHEGSPPRAVIRQGSIAKLYEEMGGQVVYIGKPYDTAFSKSMEQFNLHNIFNPCEILMVGDTPETDIRGARNFGMSSALITQTGIMSDRILKNGLANAIKGLKDNDTPDYYIERLI